MSSSFPELVFNDQEDFNAARLNMAMEVLDQRLRSLEPFSPQWSDAVDELRRFGLQRLNDAIAPAYDRVLQLATFGFLTASSETSLTLATNQDFTFVITDGPQRDLFAPTPWLAITRTGSANDYAIAQRKSYNKDTGELVVTVVSVAGNPGPFTDWWIGAMAGTTIAAMTYLTQIQNLRAEVLTLKGQTSADAVSTAADRLAVAQNTILAGQYRDDAQVAAAGLEGYAAEARAYAVAMAIALG